MQSQLELRPDIAHVYTEWRASRRRYNRLVLQRRLIKTSGATLMCGLFAYVSWFLLATA